MRSSTSARPRVRNRGTGPLPPAELLAALNDADRPIVLGHVTPDGDCLGSMFALALWLSEHGAAATAVVPGGALGKKLRFMLDLAPGLRLAHELPSGADLAIVVDTATPRRINLAGGIEPLAGVPIVNIDHHITNPDFGRFNWVDPLASSTSEMVARIGRAQHWRLTPATASLLYVGVHSDTAGFSLPSTTAESLQVAADLLKGGADVAHVGEQLLRSQGRHEFALLRRVYENTRIAPSGQVAHSTLTYAEIAETGCTADDIDDQVSIPRALRGIRIAMLFTEGEPGIVRVNLRGEGGTSVLELAEQFGGGGHPQSAGVRVRLNGRPMEQVVDELVAAAHAQLASEPG
ncbi:MAG: bifunctional oligoribonuclease/PAP phosphatase NrnA [Phycisphaerae bacterium]